MNYEHELVYFNSCELNLELAHFLHEPAWVFVWVYSLTRVLCFTILNRSGEFQTSLRFLNCKFEQETGNLKENDLFYCFSAFMENGPF